MATKRLTLQQKAESILSREKDGAGYYYGFYKSDPRQINVRFEKPPAPTGDRLLSRGSWVAYVGDTTIGAYTSKDEAEAAAIAYIERRRP